MQVNSETTLGDLGERRIVKEILPRFCVGIGDDCASLPSPSGHFVITTDPVPVPAARVLAGDDDAYWAGWLLTTINFSDIAAAGAEGLAFVAAIEAPSSLEVRVFERLLEGISDGCRRYSALYVGGNLRESDKVAATGTAIGISRFREPLTRRGAQLGDLVVSVGQGGLFWRDVYYLRTRGHAVAEESPLIRPLAKVEAMSSLHSRGLVRAAIDNSDGLLPSLAQLAEASEIAIEIDMEALSVPDLDKDMEHLAHRFWLGWGDWNVLAIVPHSVVGEATHLVAAAGQKAVPIGRVLEGPTRVILAGKREATEAPRLESERFSRDSWFTAGVDSYWEALMGVRLPH